jgi:5-methylthioribose kinase
MPNPSKIDEATVADYLRSRGILDDRAGARVSKLGGGVSNDVLLVEMGDVRVVVKQSLPRLRVEQEWLAKRERIVTEAAALELTASLTPGAAPGVIDFDEDALVLTIEAAPPGWQTWKEQLLAGNADPVVASRLGEVLATWHRETEGSANVRERFGDHEAFEQLRVDPFYRTVQHGHPELAGQVAELIGAMLARRVCLVHADFSPKNVLVGDGGLWVIDAEAAHTGDPAFDLGFLLAHLALKTAHRPESADAYAACARAFLDAYGEPPPDVGMHLACLLLARVDGKSPADYLTQGERESVRALAITLIAARNDDPLAPWRLA